MNMYKDEEKSQKRSNYDRDPPIPLEQYME